MMNDGYYPDEESFDWCDHAEMKWKETDTVYKDGSVVCEGSCSKCGYEEQELLMVNFGEDKLLKGHKVRSIIGRGNISKCCKCGEIVSMPLTLFEQLENPSYQIDLCKRCVRKLDLLNIQL